MSLLGFQANDGVFSQYKCDHVTSKYRVKKFTNSGTYLKAFFKKSFLYKTKQIKLRIVLLSF